MAKTEGKNKWILYKHTCNYEMVKAVALDIKIVVKLIFQMLSATECRRDWLH